MEKVLGVLAGTGMPPEILKRWAHRADRVLAADGGADRLLQAGVRPDRVVGDMDSISPEARQAGLDIKVEADQNSTDCDKLLALARSEGAQAITLACVEGGYTDHFLAILSSVVRSPMRVRLALEKGVAEMVKGPSEGSWFTKPDRRVSLIPILPCEGVSLDGVRWPLQNAELAPGGLISVSNQSLQAEVSVKIQTGAALLFLEVPQDEVPVW